MTSAADLAINAAMRKKGESLASHLPPGTVTLLFAHLAIEPGGGAAHSPDVLVDDHHRAVERIERLGGKVFHQAFQAGELRAVFADAGTAVNAGLAVRQVLAASSGSNAISHIAHRVALHTGEVIVRNGQYEGPAILRCACLVAAAHPGQMVLTESTALRIGDALPDEMTMIPLGMHRFEDLQRPEQVYLLVDPLLASAYPPLASLETIPNNLPTHSTTFIGRQHVMTAITREVEASRLVTLTGAGGTGKTRLAIHLAATLWRSYPDGVWLVELAALSDAGLVAEMIANAAGVKAGSGQSSMANLIESLQSRRTLMVIDNCEHLVAACGTAIMELLRDCPQLQVIATSRSPLGVPGEVVYRVPSLSLPTVGSGDISDSYDAEAIDLFVDRARLTWPQFQLSQANAHAVASICRRLDGIPLALELAAARVKVLSAASILERLHDRFRLLTGGNQTDLSRHQTLRALVDWSYNLLTEQERLLWRRLSVFADSFSAGAAEAVCEFPAHDVLNLLTELVDQSILTVQEEGQQMRFRMLETIRQYGAEKLLQSGEDAMIRDRHLKWALQLAEKARQSMSGEETPGTLERLSHDHENFRSALQWSRTRPELAEHGLRLTTALNLYWLKGAHYHEVTQHIAALLALLPEHTGLRANAFITLGTYTWMLGNFEGAKRAFTVAAAIYRKLGQLKGVGQALNNLANVAQSQGETENARSLYEEALAIAIELGEQGNVAGTLANLGNNFFHRGDYAQARTYYENALSLVRQLGETLDLPLTLCYLGILAYSQNRYEEAASYYAESLALGQKLGDPYVQALVMCNMAALLSERGEHEQGLALATQSLHLWRDKGNKEGVATALHQMSVIMFDLGHLQLAETNETESLDLRRKIGDKPGVASSLVVLSKLARARRQYQLAEALLDESLVLRQEMKAKRGIAATLYYKGVLATDLGEYDRTAEFFKQSSSLQLDLGDKRALFFLLWRIGAVALATGRLDRAARLQGAAEALRSELNLHIPPCDQPEFEQYVTQTRTQMGEGAFAQAVAEGLQLTVEEAVRYAHQVSPLT